MIPENETIAPARRAKKRLVRLLIGLSAALLLGAAALALVLRGPCLLAWLRFGIRPVLTLTDADHDLLDDYIDIMLSARRYIETNPAYVSDYFAGGYPPEGQGVCTDVVWHALKGAGYDFKAMIDSDIAAHPADYYLPDGGPDPNIDFRRVPNLNAFFKRHCLSLTLDPTDIAQWQPGDFVVYEGHVAVVSDRRNDQGQPWIIHHAGSGPAEADALNYKKIIGHYRWILTDPDNS